MEYGGGICAHCHGAARRKMAFAINILLGLAVLALVFAVTQISVK